MNAKSFLNLYTVVTAPNNADTFPGVGRFDDDVEDGEHWEAGSIKNAVAIVTETPSLLAEGNNMVMGDGKGFAISCPNASQVHRHYHASHLDERRSWPTLAEYGEYCWKKEFHRRANRPKKGDEKQKPAARKEDDEDDENNDDEEEQDY